jgi:hypothetical protein
LSPVLENADVACNTIPVFILRVSNRLLPYFGST